jgi:hypothetical protein
MALTLKLSIAGAFVVVLILLVFFSLSSTGEKGLLAHFEGVDGSDKTPLILRYKFQPGQKLVFECFAEIITTVDDYGGGDSGIQRIETRHEFDVTSVDKDGVAAMDMVLKRIGLETAGGIGHRRVEMTPDSVRVFDNNKEVKPKEDDLRVQESFVWKYKLRISPRGKVLSADASSSRTFSIRQLDIFLQNFFPELPAKELAPGEKYSAGLALQDNLPVKALKDERVFLGYKDYNGERCAVIKQNSSFKTEPSKLLANKGLWDDTRAEKISGVHYSTERGLTLFTFMRVESKWERGRRESMMRGTTQEEFVIKLISTSDSKKLESD